MAEENAVTKAKSSLPAVYDYGKYAGRGFEDQSPDEIQIPFVALLQDLSPQVTGEGEQAIPGAKAGKFFNTVTNEVYDTFEFVPACRQHLFVEWRPRAQGGGFVNRYLRDDPVVGKAISESKEFGKYKTREGNDLVETFYLFGILITPEGGTQQVCVAFSSTKIKIYKKWNTTVNSFVVPGPGGEKITPPRFAHLVKFTAMRTTNKKGKFYIPTISAAVNGSIRESLLQPNDPRFQAAAKLAEAVEKGVAKVVEEAAATAPAEEEDEGRPF